MDLAGVQELSDLEISLMSLEGSAGAGKAKVRLMRQQRPEQQQQTTHNYIVFNISRIGMFNNVHICKLHMIHA